ncbi:MAG: N-acetylmuramoyl-L-alanine amidase [Moraxellaceae bacterium]|nr:N-acetylmuramoyl-L-alanine amidase [Moraxellaceae bacterium]
MKIENHRLTGSNITHKDTPNRGGVMSPRYLIMHYTAGSSAGSSANSLCNPASKASAHIVLARDGSIIQLAPFNIVTWHAGKSQWGSLIGLNAHSIGIEIDNAGVMKRVGGQYVSWFGKVFPETEVLVAEHKHGGGAQPWHTYTEIQIERALELTELLAAHYGLEDVLGHEDIARGRKTDPGPAFPLGAFSARIKGREDDLPEYWQVTASSLNIRSGPDASAAVVAPALKKGTKLVILEALDRWSKVEVQGVTDLEGWVSNAFIERVPVGRGGRVVLSRAEAGAVQPVKAVAPRAAKSVAPRTAKKAAPAKAGKSSSKASAAATKVRRR